MAHSWIEMEDKQGRKRTLGIGFSWWALFCGLFLASFLVPMIRGQWGVFVVTLLLTIFTAGLYGLIYPFLDNLLYANYLDRNGYKPVSVRGKMTQAELDEIMAGS